MELRGDYELLAESLMIYYEERITFAECEKSDDVAALWVQRYREDKGFREWIDAPLPWNWRRHRWVSRGPVGWYVKRKAK